MSETYDVGDVVRLKSDGPAMTVERILIREANRQEYILCTWMNDAGVQRAEFDSRCIRKVTGLS